jgi:hypothetical protein
MIWVVSLFSGNNLSMTAKYIDALESGNIGYIVGHQALKWQHFEQRGGNNRQHFAFCYEFLAL